SGVGLLRRRRPDPFDRIGPHIAGGTVGYAGQGFRVIYPGGAGISGAERADKDDGRAGIPETFDEEIGPAPEERGDVDRHHDGGVPAGIWHHAGPAIGYILPQAIDEAAS